MTMAIQSHETHFSADWFTGTASLWLKRFGHLQSEPVQMLEIGSFEGRSACWLLENLLTHPESTLTCVDSWDGCDPLLGKRTLAAEHAFDANVKFSHKVRKIKGNSLQVLARSIATGLHPPFDLIFIDGDHEGLVALGDTLMCWHLLKPNGTLIFDDYNWTGAGLRSQPKDAWDAFLAVKPQGVVGELGRMRCITKQSLVNTITEES